jgi:hypothetical protein
VFNGTPPRALRGRQLPGAPAPEFSAKAEEVDHEPSAEEPDAP